MSTLTTKAKTMFCPVCGSAHLDRSLVGGLASCCVCDWHGADHELAALHFEHGSGTDEEVMRSFFLDMRKLLGETFAKEIASFLHRWGFIGAAEPKLLARYLAVSARAMVTAVIEERTKIEKELHGRTD